MVQCFATTHGMDFASNDHTTLEETNDKSSQKKEAEQPTNRLEKEGAGSEKHFQKKHRRQPEEWNDMWVVEEIATKSDKKR